MKKLLFIMVLVTSLFGEKIGENDFSDDYKKVLQQAKKENKRVYVLITSATCGWCRKFENETLVDWTVAEKLDNYLLLHLDRDKNFIPPHLKSKRVPRHYFLTPDEQEIMTFLGYWSVGDFNSFVDDVEWQYNDKKRKGLIK